VGLSGGALESGQKEEQTRAKDFMYSVDYVMSWSIFRHILKKFIQLANSPNSSAKIRALEMMFISRLNTNYRTQSLRVEHSSCA
jgi:hypothetical protein